LFWLNGESFMPLGGLRHLSDNFGSKFQVLEISVGYVCINYKRATCRSGWNQMDDVARLPQAVGMFYIFCT
jgi:hypothetical protein